MHPFSVTETTASQLCSAWLLLLLPHCPLSTAPGAKPSLLTHSDCAEEAMEGQWLSVLALAVPRRRELTQCSRPCPPERGWEGTGLPVLQVEKEEAVQGEQAAHRCMKGALVRGLQNSLKAETTDSGPVPLDTGGTAQKQRSRDAVGLIPLPVMQKVAPGLV